MRYLILSKLNELMKNKAEKGDLFMTDIGMEYILYICGRRVSICRKYKHRMFVNLRVKFQCVPLNAYHSVPLIVPLQIYFLLKLIK